MRKRIDYTCRNDQEAAVRKDLVAVDESLSPLYFRHNANDLFQDIWYNSARIAPEKPILLSQHL